MRNVIGAHGVERAVGERGPDGRDVIGFAKRRLTHPERGVGTRELRAREVQIERARLTEHSRPTLSFSKRVERRARAEVNEVDRGTASLGEVAGLPNGFHLGLDRPTVRKVLDTGPPGGVQRRGPCGYDRVVLGMDRDQCASICGRSQQERVVVTALDEPRRDHEDLEAGVAVAHECGDFGASGVARIGDDDVEGEVGQRPLRVARAALDATPERALLLVDHRDDGRDAAGDRGTRSVLEVIQGSERWRRREVRMEVDATWEKELALRVDLARGRAHLADRADPLAVDRDVRPSLALRRHDGPATYRDLGHALRRVKRSANATARPASMTTWIHRSTPRRPRRTTIVSPKRVPASTIT